MQYFFIIALFFSVCLFTPSPGCACGEACTVVIRGATQQILDEAERSLHDALCVLSQTVKETRTVCGGGEDSRGMRERVILRQEKGPNVKGKGEGDSEVHTCVFPANLQLRGKGDDCRNECLSLCVTPRVFLV